MQYESEEWQILQRHCKTSVSANFGAQEEHEAMKQLNITFKAILIAISLNLYTA